LGMALTAPQVAAAFGRPVNSSCCVKHADGATARARHRTDAMTLKRPPA